VPLGEGVFEEAAADAARGTEEGEMHGG
jgi:hypothetical protein